MLSAGGFARRHLQSAGVVTRHGAVHRAASSVVAVSALVGTCFVLPSLALAQLAIEESDERRRAGAAWTLSRVVSRAMASSPRVRAADARVRVAEAHVEHAAMPMLRNPILGVRALFGVPDDAAATYGVFLGVPIELTPRQSLRSAEADLLIDEAEAALELERNEVRAQALAAGARLAAAQEALSIAEGRATLADQLVEAMRQQLASGATTALDLSLAEQEAGLAHAAVATRRRELEAARDGLRAVLDLDPTEAVVMGELPRIGMPRGLSLADAVRLATERRREPRIQRLSARRLRIAEHRLFAESVSPLIASFEYEMQSNLQRNQSIGVGASMELPIFWTAQGDRAVVRSEAESADVQSELLARIAGREAAAAWRVLDTSLAELRVIEEQALPATERAQTMTEQLLEAGAAELFRVLLARRASFELRERRVDILLTAWLARAELERAVAPPEAIVDEGATP
jgi:outer membrane protein TolC